MKSLFLLFSHVLTPEQEADARQNLEIDTILYLPPKLQKQWSDIDAQPSSISTLLLPLFNWLQSASKIGDIVLVQGDFGATFIAVSWCLENQLVPVYATTQRQVIETTLPDGSIEMQRIFRHQRFRKYEILQNVHDTGS